MQLERRVGAFTRRPLERHGAEIGADLVEELLPVGGGRVLQVIELFPAPDPSLEQIRAWLGDFAIRFAEQKASFALMSEVGLHPATELSQPGRKAVQSWLAALGRRNAAFRGIEDDQTSERAARGLLLFYQMIWGVVLSHWESRSFGRRNSMIEVVARSLHDFTSERSETNGSSG